MSSTSRKTALFIRAEKLRMAGRFQEARLAFEKLLESDPDDLAVRRTLAGLYLRDPSPDRIITAYMLLATCMLAEGLLRQAAGLLDRVEALKPKKRLAPRIARMRQRLESRIAEGDLRPIGEQSGVVVEEATETEASLAESSSSEVQDAREITVEEGQSAPGSLSLEPESSPTVSDSTGTPVVVTRPREEVTAAVPMAAPHCESEEAVTQVAASRESEEEVSPEEAEPRPDQTVSSAPIAEESGEETENAAAPAEGDAQEDVEDAGFDTDEIARLVVEESGNVTVVSNEEFAGEAESGDVELTDEDVRQLEDELKTRAEDATRSHARLAAALFSRLPPEVLAKLVQECRIVAFEPETSLLEAGTRTPNLLILASGAAEARARLAEGPEEVVITRYGEGNLLGLISFLTDEPQQTRIVAQTACEGYVLKRETLEELMGSHPEFGMAVLDAYRKRVITLFLQTSRFFSALSPRLKEELADAFELAQARRDETIIAEGSTDDDLFFIKSGTVRVETLRGGETVVLGRMGKHAFFGEISFLTGRPRTASVVACGKVELFKIDGERMRTIAKTHEEMATALRNVQMEHALEAAQALSRKPTG